MSAHTIAHAEKALFHGDIEHCYVTPNIRAAADVTHQHLLQLALLASFVIRAVGFDLSGQMFRAAMARRGAWPFKPTTPSQKIAGFNNCKTGPTGADEYGGMMTSMEPVCFGCDRATV